ncbi:MAG TPA: oxygenase MpaB family protein [Trebonia sp.]|jgi:hypothetical protein
MTATDLETEPGTASPYPARFRGAPERSARLARALRVIAGVRKPDEDLTSLIGRRMLERDELAADLVRAMRADGARGQTTDRQGTGRQGTDRQGTGRQGTGSRVTMAQLRKALEEGIDAVPDPPEALTRFFGVVDQVPDWVDFDLVDQGARVIRRMGKVAGDVLLQLSLIGGYRFGGPADLLVATGGLAGATAMRRLGETETWTLSVTTPGAMRRYEDGFKLTVHVRLMHALINDRFERGGRWDTDRWGLPISQADLAGTLGLFSGALLIGARALGWLVTPQDSRAVMHLWKYAGWLMGVNEDWLFDTERQQNLLNYHILRCQDGQTPAGGALSAAIVDGERGLDRGPLRSWYAHVRLLSLLRYLLGRESMRDLGLPVTLPWVVPFVAARNLGLSAIGLTAPGRRYLDRVAGRHRRARRRLLFGDDAPAVGPLPVPSGQD